MSVHEQIEPVGGLIRRDNEGNVNGFASAFALPDRDVIATTEGIGVPAFMTASDPDTRAALISHLENEHGLSLKTVDPGKTVRIHGFSAKNWNSPWEPTGPKPNWLVIKNPEE